MSELKLGQIIDNLQQRDAIHIAIAPVIAAERLAPGDDIGFVGTGVEVVGRVAKPIGIVDPFLKTRVSQGERFWMFLYPQTITSLRHDWTHPAFVEAGPAETDQAKSERWLRVFAEEVGVTYAALMDAAADVADGGYGLCLNYDTPDVVYKNREEAWKHYQIVTGRKVENTESAIFHCSC